jgi:hypothetical protein
MKQYCKDIMKRQTMLIIATAASVLNAFAAEPAKIVDVAQGMRPSIAADGAGRIHAVFESFTAGTNNREILYSQSSDITHTWTAPVNVSKTAGVSTVPAIAIEKSGAIDVVWRDTASGELHPDIFFSRSTDSGQTWTKAVDISHTTAMCSEPAVSVGPDNSIHVAWVDTRSTDNRPDIFYRSSLDGGKTWGKQEDISPTPGVSSVPTLLTCSDGIVHCAWLDSTPGEERPDIFYVRKINNVWTTPLDVSNSPRMSGHPWLACGGKSKIFLCWNDNSQKENAADIWCSIGKNGRFDKPINISDTPGVSSQPVVVANSIGYVAVVWSDTSRNLAKPDIFARASTDNGDDFSNVLCVSDTEGFSKYPAVALVGTKMIVVWQDTKGSVSFIKATVMELKGIGTGPVDQVEPTIHRLNRT